MITMTIVFGIFGIVETTASMALAFTLSTERFLLVAPIVPYAIAGVMMAWVILYVVATFRREAAPS
jgi:hypothetical protein